MKLETVVEPNDHIFEIQRRYIQEIGNLLTGRHIEAVGGMAVPMAGRSELDILVITEDIEGDTEKLTTLGFGHRGFADDALYLKQIVEGVEVTVQIMKKDNKMIEIHRKLIALLRKDKALRKRYEEYKRTLSGLERYEYKEKKGQFLKEHILPRIREGK